MAKRKAVGFLMTELGLSERRSCRLVGLARSVQQYRPMPKDDATVVARMKDLASEYSSYDCPRVEVARLIGTGSERFISGFPPRLRRHRFGHRLVEVGLIGGFPVKR